jgi:hypothetical protein
MVIRRLILIGMFSTVFFSSKFFAATSEWKMQRNDSWTSVVTTATAEINNLRVDAALKLECNKKMTMLRFEMADFEKLQKVFDVRVFEGPDAPTRALPLTTIELEGANPSNSLSVGQNGFISVQHRFVFETGGAQKTDGPALAQLYRRMAKEGNSLRIRIKSYRDPKQFITSVFPLKNSRKTIAEFAAACVSPH